MEEVMSYADRMRIVTTRNSDGTLTTSILNSRSETVGTWENHNFPGEALETLARRFRADHPELFSDLILVDTATQSERKNPKQYTGDGKLTTIPEA
jgi:hypothetical protein